MTCNLWKVSEFEPRYLPKSWKPENVTRVACSIIFHHPEKNGNETK